MSKTCMKCGGLGHINAKPDTDRVVIGSRICDKCMGSGREQRPNYIGLVMAQERKKDG